MKRLAVILGVLGGLFLVLYWPLPRVFESTAGCRWNRAGHITVHGTAVCLSLDGQGVMLWPGFAVGRYR